jgi:protein-tyrosine-phosphatase
MSMEASDVVRDRARRHAALAEPVRLAIVDHLAAGDRSPSELGLAVGLGSNLLAHHLRVLEDAGITQRRRSQGDGRRSYVTLDPDAFTGLLPVGGAPDVLGKARRVVFVCTANSARSQLATASWRRLSTLPSTSAGTSPAARVAPGAVACAKRHGLELDGEAPRHLDDVLRSGDVVISVCDNAHEELDGLDTLHWAVPDPVPANTARAFDAAVDELTRRTTTLARGAA